MEKTPVVDVRETVGHAGEEFEPVGAELRVGAKNAFFEVRAFNEFEDAVPETAKFSFGKKLNDVGMLESLVDGTAPVKSAAFFPVKSQFR